MDVIKLKNLKPVLELTYPKTGPEKNEASYRASLLVTKLIKPRQEWDKARNSVTLDLVHAEHELVMFEEELKTVKERSKREFKVCDQQWKDLEVKQIAFRKNFIKFDRFVKENQEKRDRALKKFNDENNIGYHNDMMTQELKEKYKQLLEVKVMFEDQLKDYKIYDEFLTGVMYLVPSYKDPPDIMARHESLVEMKGEVLKRRNREFDELDSLKAQHSKMVDDHMLRLLALNSKIVDLICRHEFARNKALMWEEVVAEIRNQAEEKIAEIDSVRMGMWELYKIMCDRRQTAPKVESEDFEQQAIYIKTTLWTLHRISQILSRNPVEEISNKPGASSKKRPVKRSK